MMIKSKFHSLVSFVLLGVLKTRKIRYLVLRKSYFKEENLWQLASAIQYLQKLRTTFYKDHLDKLTTMSPSINIVLPMARPSIKPIKSTSKTTEITKRKQGQPSKNNASKRTKKN